MAWIQIHQNLKDHRKLYAAADDLEVSPAHMLGLLVSFWLWALDNTPDGNLAGVSARNISRAAQWERDPDDFVEALKNAGFLDTDATGSLTIHDWHDYAGKLCDRRESEKLRSRRRRADRRTATRTAAGRDGGQTAGRTADGQQTDRAETDGIEKSRVEKSREEKNINASSDEDASSAAVPYSKIVDLYHATCPSYPAIRNMSTNRRRAIAARWKEYKGSMDAFQELFTRAEASPFLKGQNARNWSADFNWLMNSDNMAKVLEGKYNDSRQRFTPARPSAAGRTSTLGVLAAIAADGTGGEVAV